MVSVATMRKDEGKQKPASFLTVPKATEKSAAVATDAEAVKRKESAEKPGDTGPVKVGRGGLQADFQRRYMSAVFWMGHLMG